MVDGKKLRRNGHEERGSMKVATTEEMRAMENYAIETLGIADEILMENAGIAAYYALAGEMDIAGGRFAVFCGGGNNGGDGFVVARKIHSGGGIVKVFLLAGKEPLQGGRAEEPGSAPQSFRRRPSGGIRRRREGLHPSEQCRHRRHLRNGARPGRGRPPPGGDRQHQCA